MAMQGKVLEVSGLSCMSPARVVRGSSGCDAHSLPDEPNEALRNGELAKQGIPTY
jgi:hypothetical protein